MQLAPCLMNIQWKFSALACRKEENYLMLFPSWLLPDKKQGFSCIMFNKIINIWHVGTLTFNRPGVT